MTTLTQKMNERFFGCDEHPYRFFEREIERYLRPYHTILDAGCGRSANLLLKYKRKAKKLIGVDLVDFDPKILHENIELLSSDLIDIKLESESVNLVISRSVLEHLKEPLTVFLEIHRVLKQGGYFIFLAPNLGHYTTIFSKLIPNKFHSWIVSKTEGREEQDVFSTYYRSNSFYTIKKLAQKSGFTFISINYLGQYPNYFNFNPALFIIATAYEKVINRFNFLSFLRGWLLVVLKKE